MQPKMIAYDPATGEIIGICVTPPQVLAWQAQGLSTLDAAEEVEMETHWMQQGQVVTKTVVTLTPDKSEITADGEDQAVVTVTVSGENPPESLEVTVGDQSETVTLVDGVGALSPISATTSCAVLVSVTDSIAYISDPVIIQAVSDE